MTILKNLTEDLSELHTHFNTRLSEISDKYMKDGNRIGVTSVPADKGTILWDIDLDDVNQIDSETTKK